MSVRMHMLLLAYLCAQAVHAVEFFFPVLTKKNSVYFIQQRSLFNRIVSRYDTHHKQLDQALPAFLLPTELQLLPNQTGLSFLHNDCIYIKPFTKRSSKRIEFFEPIYAITGMRWVDDTTYLFSARTHCKRNIFQSNIQGELNLFFSQTDADCTCPQTVGNAFFCCVRSQDKTAIVSADYLDMQKKQTVCSIDSRLAGYLHMISESLGFFIVQEKQTKCVYFSCWQLFKADNNWHTKNLFIFAVPTAYLCREGDERLYESIEAFLPFYANNIIYFASADEEEMRMKIYAYDLITSSTCLVISDQHRSVFAPIMLDNILYYGVISQ